MLSPKVNQMLSPRAEGRTDQPALGPHVFRGPCDAAIGRIVHEIEERFGREFQAETAAESSTIEEEPQRKRSRGRRPLIDKTIAVSYEDGNFYRGVVRTYSVERSKYLVRYEDGDESWHLIDETTGKLDRKREFVVCPSEDMVPRFQQTGRPFKARGPSTGGKRSGSCGQCVNCLRQNCGDCHHCRDMPSFGGPNRLRKRCKMRICIDMRIRDSKPQQQATPTPTPTAELQPPNDVPSNDEPSGPDINPSPAEEPLTSSQTGNTTRAGSPISSNSDSDGAD
jgi:hypothetical protein